MNQLNKLYEEAHANVLLQIEELLSKVTAHATLQKGSTSWAFLGDINYISTELKELNKFLK